MVYSEEKKYARLQNRISEGLEKNAIRNMHFLIFYKIPEIKPDQFLGQWLI